MLHRLWDNQWVQLILAFAVVVGLFIVLKMTAHIQVGPGGVQAGIDRHP